MATQEERLTALEQKVATLTHNSVAAQGDFFTQCAAFNRTANTLNSMFSDQERAIKDVHHEITILTGVIGSQGQDIKVIKEDLGTIKSDLGTLTVHVETLEQNVNNRFETLEQNVNNRFETLEQNVNNRFEVQDKRLASFEQSVNNRFEAQDKKLDQVLVLLSKITPGTQQ